MSSDQTATGRALAGNGRKGGRPGKVEDDAVSLTPMIHCVERRRGKLHGGRRQREEGEEKSSEAEGDEGKRNGWPLWGPKAQARGSKEAKPGIAELLTIRWCIILRGWSKCKQSKVAIMMTRIMKGMNCSMHGSS